MAEEPLTVYYPAMPCGKMPAQCVRDSRHESHEPHDWGQGDWAHCYGMSVKSDGGLVGWWGGTVEPNTRTVEACQNNK